MYVRVFASSIDWSRKSRFLIPVSSALHYWKYLPHLSPPRSSQTDPPIHFPRWWRGLARRLMATVVKVPQRAIALTSPFASFSLVLRVPRRLPLLPFASSGIKIIARRRLKSSLRLCAPLLRVGIVFLRLVPGFLVM